MLFMKFPKLRDLVCATLALTETRLQEAIILLVKLLPQKLLHLASSISLTSQQQQESIIQYNGPNARTTTIDHFFLFAS